MSIFKEIVKKLNERNIYPIIYGSLGLRLKINEDIAVNDIDFIVNKPEEFFICKGILIKDGFRIDPDHERELAKDSLYVSFIDRKDVEKLINESLKLSSVLVDGISFFNIETNQYLKIYKVGIENKYRKEKREADDLKKIDKIENYLNTN